MMEKIRLTLLVCLLSFVVFIIDHDDIVMSPHLNVEIENYNAIDVQVKDFKTFGDLRSLVLDNCMNDINSRLILDRYVGILGIKSNGDIIIDQLNTCSSMYRFNYNNILMISDRQENDPRNINLLDSDKGIYNKLMFHYLNYGARPLYAQRPDKAILEVRMSDNLSIETFDQLMTRVAIQCEKLDKNFPDMIPSFSVMFETTPIAPPVTSIYDQ